MNTFTRNLKALCSTIPGCIKKDGSLNASKAAAELEMSQAVMSRLLSGQHEYTRPENEEKICNYFKITKGQLYSEELADRIIHGSPLSEIERAREIIKGLSKQERAQLFMDEAPELVEFFTKED